MVDPKSILRYSVIRARIRFPESTSEESKLFVALFHSTVGGDGAVLCAKTTSNSRYYHNNPDALDGCVRRAAGSVGCLPLETFIPTNNLFPIPYENVEAIEGEMDDQFGDEVKEAVRNSRELNGKRKRGLLERLS